MSKGNESQQAGEVGTYNGPQWSTWTRRLVTVILLIASVYAATLLVPIIQVLIISSLLTFLLFAPARAITRRSRVPYSLSVIWFYVLFILLFSFLVIVFIPSLINWVDGIINSMQQSLAELEEQIDDYNPNTDGIVVIVGQEVDLNFVIEPVLEFLSDTSADPLDEAAAETPGETSSETASASNLLEMLQIDLRDAVNSIWGVVGSLTGTLTSAVTGVAAFVIQTLLVFFLSFLFLLNVPSAYDTLFNLIPRSYHREYSLLIDRIIDVWNGFFRGQVIVGLVIGLLTWIQLILMGIPGAEVLAVFTGIISLIPTIGGLIALIPLALVPLLQGSTVITNLSPLTLALAVVIVSLIIQAIIWNIVQPKIMGDAVALPLPIIVIGLFIGTAIGGILGAFLIAPIMGTIRVALEYTISKLKREDPYPGEEEPAILREGLFAPPRPKHQLKGKGQAAQP